LLHRQLLVDFWLDDRRVLRFVEPIWSVVRAAIVESGATLLAEHVHQFEPHGFTGLVLLAQSHVSVHTWVDQGLLLLDAQSCGRMQPEIIVERLRSYLRPQRLILRRLVRGSAELPVPGITEAWDDVGSLIEVIVDGGERHRYLGMSGEECSDAFRSSDHTDEPHIGDTPAS
jgi:S-adenosylmethionine decarboxylase proenzyme